MFQKFQNSQKILCRVVFRNRLHRTKKRFEKNTFKVFFR